MFMYIRWTGHVFNGELKYGKHRRDSQQKFLKDIITQNITSCSINTDNYEDIAKHRPERRAIIHEGCKQCEEDRHKKLIKKGPRIMLKLQCQPAVSYMTAIHDVASCGLNCAVT